MGVYESIVSLFRKRRAVKMLAGLLLDVSPQSADKAQSKRLAHLLVSQVWRDYASFLDGEMCHRPQPIAIVAMALSSACQSYQHMEHRRTTQLLTALSLLFERLNPAMSSVKLGTWDQIMLHDAHVTYHSLCQKLGIEDRHTDMECIAKKLRPMTACSIF